MKFDFNNVKTLKDVENRTVKLGQKGFFADDLASLRRNIEEGKGIETLKNTEDNVAYPFYSFFDTESKVNFCYQFFYPIDSYNELTSEQIKNVGRKIKSKLYDIVCLITDVHLNDKGECFYILGNGDTYKDIEVATEWEFLD